MSRLHDLGGVRGFGTIDRFSAVTADKRSWQSRVKALDALMKGNDLYNLHQMRAAREVQPPWTVLNASYFGLRLAALETLLEQVLAEGPIASYRIDEQAESDGGNAARFSPGEQVRVATDNPVGHSRVPNYVRGRIGTVERVGKVTPYASDIVERRHAVRRGPVYTVAFTATELWGRDGADTQVISADIWGFDLVPVSGKV